MRCRIVEGGRIWSGDHAKSARGIANPRSGLAVQEVPYGVAQKRGLKGRKRLRKGATARNQKSGGNGGVVWGQCHEFAARGCEDGAGKSHARLYPARSHVQVAGTKRRQQPKAQIRFEESLSFATSLHCSVACNGQLGISRGQDRRAAASGPLSGAADRVFQII